MNKLKDMKQADPKEIAHHLRKLFLCCCSHFISAIDTLMKAQRFNMKLEIGGHENPGYSLFVTMAQRLGVGFEEISVKADAKGTQFAWLSDHSTPRLRAWVPDMQNREGDFHVLCPFFFRYHLTELRKHEPDFPSPKIDNLYLLLLWELCFGPRQMPISARILKDLLAWEKSKVLTVHTYIDLVGDEIATVSEKASTLKELAQLYLGFWSGSDAWDLIHRKPIANHPINVRSRKHLSAMRPPATQAVARYPVLLNQYVWETEQLSIITKNVWALDKYTLAEVTKARQCLLFRTQGRSEHQIQVELGFSTPEEYYKWQVNRFLDNSTGRLGDVYKAWLKACEYFDLQPNQELLDQIMNPPTAREGEAQPFKTAATKVTVDANSAVASFVHSPDYRSVKLPNGKSFPLTERQSQVIALLHENLKQGTPELSTAFVVEEVYPGVSESRLRRLFDDNETYDSLIEKGSKRGTVRLRDCCQ